MLPVGKTLFRTGVGLHRSRAVLDEAWTELRDHAAPGGRDQLRARDESCGLHWREDCPESDPAQAHRLLVGGLDEVWTAADWPLPTRRALELTP